jgi:hypothetical protein
VKGRVLGGLVDARRQLDRQDDARYRRSETEIGRRVVDRVGVEDHESVDFAAVHLAGQIADARTVASIYRERLDIAKRAAGRAEGRVVTLRASA